MWEINTYTVTFLKNDNDADGTMTPQSIDFDATVPLAQNGFYKTGWSFAGWSTSSGSEVEYTDEADYTMQTENDTLFAQWTIIRYPVVFHSQGGSDIPRVMVDSGKTVPTVTAPTLTGYSFGGWFREATCSTPWLFGTDIVTDSLDLYAKWYFGNLPGPSAGCGKTFETLESGTYTITSAGLSREYIISIPDNYDQNEPSRLVFCMHWMNGSMQAVADDGYYQLEPLDTDKNTIFVAPQGYSDTYPWRIDDDKDHIFFEDLLTLLKDTLCVDTTRVFAAGFSFGAMFTYSISTDFQQQLRAVACYAPANWNIWLPADANEPIAYMQTTGMSDGTCAWVYNESLERGGKYCAINHATDNGCSDPSDITIWSTGDHLEFDFQGCREGYPVKICTFNGGHTDRPVDDDASASWVPGVTWKFFLQF